MALLITRRQACLNFAGALAAIAGLPRLAAAQSKPSAPAKPATPAKPTLVVYKDAACGCCHTWVEHMEANGWKAVVTNTNMGPIKIQHKIPAELQSCHTTIVGGYVIEGHVPSSDVAKLLAQKPKGIAGLTIPGMPASAPGMDITPFRPYTVLTFDANGKTAVFAQHDKPGL
jgi:hypothetical protein